MIQDIAPHRYDVTYKNADAEQDDIMLIYDRGALLCSCRASEDSKLITEVEFPTVGEVAQVFPRAAEKAKFMFSIDDRNYFEIRDEEIEPFEQWQYVSRVKFRDMRPIWKAFTAITGSQIHDWYSSTKFCGCCGSRMVAQGKERAMACPQCGTVVYPTICPSVIVGVIDGDRLLMTKYAANHSPYRRYALVAGYAEVGESLEDTVRREVKEEVGLKVKNIRYYKSQPWSYTNTLLVGFFCDLDGSDDIDMDENELSVAEWLTRDEIPRESADPSISLTGEMMKEFKEGHI